MVVLESPRVSRTARCYAPQQVTDVLEPMASAPQLGLVLDVDALERTAFAKIDRVMILALEALAGVDVAIVLAARAERGRALRLVQVLPAAAGIATDGLTALAQLHAAHAQRPVLVITDDHDVLASLGDGDRGLAVGRPELASSTVCAIGDTVVRAGLWWLLHTRNRLRGDHRM